MIPRLSFTALFALVAACSSDVAAQGLSAVSMQSGDAPNVLAAAQVSKNNAKTSCLIRQVADKAELQGKTFRNNLTGTLAIGRDFSMQPGNQMLTYSNDASLDNKLPLKIGAELYLLVMEKTGDQIDIDGGILGVGTKLRFEPGKWTSLLGAQYRGGGAVIGSQGLELLEGTEKRAEGAGSDSDVTQRKTPPELEALLKTHPDMAESVLPALEQAILQEIRTKGVGDRFVIKEIMPQGGMPGSMTLVQAEKGSLTVQMEFAGDALPIVNNEPFAFGSSCIHRFKGRVELDMKGDIYTFISDDDKLNRLTFALVDRVGYVYLRGKGRVILKDGREIALGPESIVKI